MRISLKPTSENLSILWMWKVSLYIWMNAKKGIQVDLMIKYGIKKNLEDEVQEISNVESIVGPPSNKKLER